MGCWRMAVGRRQKTAYLVNSGLAALAEMRLPRSTLNEHNHLLLLNPLIPSPEPAHKGRAGGSGKKAKDKKAKREKHFFGQRAILLNSSHEVCIRSLWRRGVNVVATGLSA